MHPLQHQLSARDGPAARDAEQLDVSPPGVEQSRSHLSFEQEVTTSAANRSVAREQPKPDTPSLAYRFM